MINQQFRSWTVINLDNFRYNITQLKKFLKPGVELMQIVKADAYGHGSVEIARESEKLGLKWLGVANSDEGVLLRLEQINSRILILSPSFPNEIEDMINYDLTPTISSIGFAKELNRFATQIKKTVKIHINFDTGMGRAGFLWNQVKKVVSELKKLKNIRIEGVFSHFSMSENKDNEFSTIQVQRFDSVLSQLKSAGINPKIIHLENSAALVNFPDFQYDMVRVGLLSYGIYTDETLREKIKLRPVMTFKSKVSLIKEFPADFGISYNKTYVTQRPTRTAILPIGYGDGYNFLLSNLGKVIIDGKICPMLGRVTMDMMVVDISNVKNVKVGDEVTLLGSNEHCNISAEELSELYNGLSYETVCNFGRRAQRIFIKEDKGTTIEPISRRTFIAKDFSNTKLEKIIQTSLNQRLNSNEIGSIIYQELLKNLFSTADREVNWKTNFVHSVKFSEVKSPIIPVPADAGIIGEMTETAKQFYLTKTKLSYHKKLVNEKFKIVCANNIADLEKYFLSEDVEYRWLLDSKIDLINSFHIDKIMINDIILNYEIKKNNHISHPSELANLEIECSHSQLKPLIGKDVKFTIDTTTYYPKTKHQLTIYLAELTKGISVTFDFSETNIKNVETISIFAGKEKYPKEFKKNGIITLKSYEDEWFFPNSGVVFVW
ncbi:MAG: alanine racemase [Candidatus Cloacimonadota bacterium]|nr:alanine racemase [Candidatus Cloacimonadota bacterium]